MSMFKQTMRTVLAAGFVTLGTLLPAAIAEGVTQEPIIRDAEPLSSVTTGAATRASAEVQIRRIKTLMLTKTSDSDAEYDRLEKLQKDLRGER